MILAERFRNTTSESRLNGEKTCREVVYGKGASLPASTSGSKPVPTAGASGLGFVRGKWRPGSPGGNPPGPTVAASSPLWSSRASIVSQWDGTHVRQTSRSSSPRVKSLNAIPVKPFSSDSPCESGVE